MNQKITKGIKELLEVANKETETLSVEEVINFLNDDNYLIIDVRDYREIKREGKIPGAFSCPRGMLEFWIDPKSPYHKDIFNKKKIYIFYCASAWRSALASKTALDMGLKPVYHLKGGFNEWVKKNGSVEKIT
jgi:rhodanese-related sulfurtransferase